MTNEEAITRLKGLYGNGYMEQEQALDMAIKALEQEPCDDAISRQSMHIELEKWIIYGEYKYSNATKYLYDRIDRLPSVTPQQKAEKTDGVIAELEKIKESIKEIRGDNKYVVSDYMCGRYQAFDIVDDIIADRIAELKKESEEEE